MTLSEVEQKVAALEAELILLRQEILRLQGSPIIRGFGPVGTFKNDVTFLEAARFGKAYRDKVNRESLKELDRDRARDKPKKKAKKSNARA
jgi:hypothetical protein